ncbi:major facilitator superfamily domain-containing protein [Phlyctochytrium arcticum]|nr:major facilitator superfamily domain-containing protein [Phlyctochytrium arcticum]
MSIRSRSSSPAVDFNLRSSQRRTSPSIRQARFPTEIYSDDDTALNASFLSSPLGGSELVEDLLPPPVSAGDDGGASKWKSKRGGTNDRGISSKHDGKPSPSIFQPPSSLPVQRTLLLLTTVLPEILIHHMLTPLYPYMTRSLLPPELGSRTGYYAGLLQSAYAFPTVFMDAVWGHLSDKVGRPPVLVWGLAGYALGTACLGLSTSYWLSVLALALTGFFSSNSVVAKGMIGELARDDASRAWAFSAYGVVFAAAGMLGTLLGGFLADPNLFDNKFLQERPYFVACSFGTVLALIGILITYRCLMSTNGKETRVYTTVGDEDDLELTDMVGDVDPGGSSYEDLSRATLKDRQTFRYRFVEFITPYRSLLTIRTLIPVVMYSVYKLCHTVLHSSLPLLASEPIIRGGLGLPAKSTSFAMTVLSGVKLLTKGLYYPIHQRLGTRWAYGLGAFLMIPAALIAPLGSNNASSAVATVEVLARFTNATVTLEKLPVAPVNGAVWPALYIATSLAGVAEGLMYLSSIMLLTASVPENQFGLVHGLAGCVGSVMKTIGPILAGWAWEWGANHGMTWTVFSIVALTALVGVFTAGWMDPAAYSGNRSDEG